MPNLSPLLRPDGVTRVILGGVEQRCTCTACFHRCYVLVGAPLATCPHCGRSEARTPTADAMPPDVTPTSVTPTGALTAGVCRVA